MSSTPASGVRALRRAELDAVGACVPELEDALGDLLRRARDAEALERRRLARLERERRVEMCDDVEVRLDRDTRSFASPVAVLVDDADRSRRRPSPPGCRASRAQRGRGRDSRCRRASARPRPFPPSAPSPAPTSRSCSGTESRSRGYVSAVPGSSVKRSPAKPASSPASSARDDRDRFAERGERPLLLDAELVEPRPLREAEIRASARDRVEHRDLAGDLVRMQRERVERGRPESDPLRHAGHEQQRPDRRLVEQVVVDGENVDAARLGPPRERLVLLRRLVRANADAELAGYVSSSVTSVRSPIRSMRMTSRSSGSGHATSESCSSQSSSGSRRIFAGSSGSTAWMAKRQKCLPSGNADAARLGHLEEVAHLEPADRATLDALDGDAQVVEPHLGHNGYQTDSVIRTRPPWRAAHRSRQARSPRTRPPRRHP